MKYNNPKMHCTISDFEVPSLPGTAGMSSSVRRADRGEANDDSCIGSTHTVTSASIVYP